ncbi:unnamed protein product [Rotaria socialis]|uniref:Uncharacterized protein n=1 Tax=Rotaria socialis TaxID=392032 RepID=A0A817VX61_9BILA|nr:unnamed protein product [Rotaria socialis]CAF3324985.1 unnamed protein product [Rotaria socialis]CAF3344977.1 unnamed protein product [Rotaria socialis]CAF3644999.1 unnamed protein product [Rotaria socialis]CAF3696706.1 unnamed protein product [Rotaria socialis]
MKLCLSDTAINYILQNELTSTIFFDILGALLSVVNDQENGDNNLHLNILSIMAIANILWSVSFHHRYKIDRIEMFEMLNRLEALRLTSIIDKVAPNIFIRRHMSSLKKSD